jgi:hypothetical protein
MFFHYFIGITSRPLLFELELVTNRKLEICVGGALNPSIGLDFFPQNLGISGAKVQMTTRKITGIYIHRK